MCNWLGISLFGLMLVGLVMMGGGVVIMVGGVKLLCVYVLVCYFECELEKIVYLVLVGGGGLMVWRLCNEGVYLVFIFFMLFVSFIVVVVMLILL